MSTSTLIALVTAPLLASTLFAAVVVASQNFESTYLETLCRMETARARALEALEQDRTLEPEFGGDECIVTPTPMTEPLWPTPSYSDLVAPTPAPG